jgi:hypothetical protein
MLAAALGSSLFINNMTSYMAGLWAVILILAALVSSSRRGCKNTLDWLMLLFGGYILAHMIFIKPVFHMFMTVPVEQGVVLRQPAYDVFIRGLTLLSMPMIYFCCKRSAVKHCGAVLAILAALWCGMYALGVENIYRTSTMVFNGENWVNLIGPLNRFEGVSWPLINKNNAAALMNIGLIASFGWFLKERFKPAAFLSALFGAALLATHSVAGLLAGVIGISALMAFLMPKMRVFMLAGAGLCAPLVFFIPNALDSFKSRLPIWDSTIKIIADHPLGTGIGTFQQYYAVARTEFETAGMFAHNDVLHLASEAGLLGGLLFLLPLIYIAFNTTARNIVPACVLLGVFIQAMVEFQFYVPSIAMLSGLAVLEWREAA